MLLFGWRHVPADDELASAPDIVSSFAVVILKYLVQVQMEPVEFPQRLLPEERPYLRDNLNLILVREQLQFPYLCPAADAELHQRGLQNGFLVLAPPDALAAVAEARRLGQVLLLI